MLELLERQKRLTVNQWKIISAAILGDMLDFFDFFLIGYVLAFIVGEWKLTFLQSGTILLAAGIGAIPGAFFWGWMADRIGRRKVFVATVLNFSLATGLMAASPDQYGWLFLAFCRMLVGIGVAGMVTVDLPLVQEFVPSSKRGWVGGLVTTTVSVGGALGAAAGAYLGPSIGWRGLFLIGLLPALMTLMIRAWVPESPRWLIRRGRTRRRAPVDRLGLADRPERHRIAGRPPRTAAHAVARVVQISAQRGAGLPDRAVADERRRARVVGADLVAAIAQDRRSRSLLSDDLGRRLRLRRPHGVHVAAGSDRAPGLGHADLPRRRGDPDRRRLSRRRLYRRGVGLLADADGAFLLRRRLLHDHRALHGRGVAGGVARERHGAGLWRRQSRQDHQPAGTGADRRRRRTSSSRRRRSRR